MRPGQSDKTKGGGDGKDESSTMPEMTLKMALKMPDRVMIFSLPPAMETGIRRMEERNSGHYSPKDSGLPVQCHAMKVCGRRNRNISLQSSRF